MSPTQHHRLEELVEARGIARMVVEAFMDRRQPWQTMEIDSNIVDVLPQLRSDELSRARPCKKNGDER